MAQPRTGGDRLAVFAGFAGLVALGAAEQPMLLTIDDAQWLDTPSAECLAYLARRLDGSSIGLIATAREGTGQTVLGEALGGRLPLRGLDRDDARAVIRAAAGDLAPETEEALLDAALGNPLALRELPGSLSEKQRRGEAIVEPAPEPGTTLWRALEARITGLAPSAQAAALVVAASVDGATTAITCCVRRARRRWRRARAVRAGGDPRALARSRNLHAPVAPRHRAPAAARVRTPPGARGARPPQRAGRCGLASRCCRDRAG